jgi:hypothetical protein
MVEPSNAEPSAVAPEAPQALTKSRLTGACSISTTSTATGASTVASSCNELPRRRSAVWPWRRRCCPAMRRPRRFPSPISGSRPAK